MPDAYANITAAELIAKLQALTPEQQKLPVVRMCMNYGAMPIYKVEVHDYTDNCDVRSVAVLIQ